MAGKCGEDRVGNRLGNVEMFFESWHTGLAFQVGQNVLLSTKNLAFSSSYKLSHRWIDFFHLVQQITQVAYKLTLPQTLVGLHPVFHVSKFKPYVWGGGDDMGFGTKPEPVMVDAQSEYEVYHILYKHGIGS